MQFKEFLSSFYAKNTKKSDIFPIYDTLEYISGIMKYRLACFGRY